MNADPHAPAGQRLLLSRARIQAQLAVPEASAAAGPQLAIDLLEGADPADLAWAWAREQADRRLGDPVRAHPWTSLGLGFGTGVLIALARPWRLRLPAPLLLALASQLLLPSLARQATRPRDGAPP